MRVKKKSKVIKNELSVSVRRAKEIREIIKQLEKLWLFAPYQRLGQLLENYVFTSGTRGDDTSIRMFYQQDSETLVKVQFYTAEQKTDMSKKFK